MSGCRWRSAAVAASDRGGSWRWRRSNASARRGCAGQRWAELSNWERLLVGLARGIASSPKLLVVDDLMDGFGIGRTREAGELLLALVRELGCGVLMSCSDLEAALVADRVWSLERGRLTLLAEQGGELGEVIDFPGSARQSHGSRRLGG